MSTSTSISVPVKRTLDQTEDLSTAIITIKKDYNYYLELTNWQLNSEVDEDAYVEAFPLLIDREKFIEDLKNYYKARKTMFSRIERILPKEKDHESFDEIQEWRTTILQGPKFGAKIALDKSSSAPVLYYCSYCNHFRKIKFCKRCKKSINDDDFDSESNESVTLSSITEGSQKSLKNKGIFDDVIKNYSSKYISSQSGSVENEYIFWSDNELRMDDSDNEFII
ncbi:24201_t:CDS:2 [Dentiscutata erythropus]|uniref:24201_t:CDS:1 n=1 Tax=Dentiscutata erythropus TaxID=1348616 RepID=A0A9N9J4K4_9GLOM|nr:24201_t:CDS:2 [Dentiscutata erythropus]